MTLKDFQDALQEMNEAELEQFVVALLRRSGRFTDLKMFHGAREYGKDIVGFESDVLLSKPRRWVFQVKKMRLVSADVANYLRFIAKAAENEDPATQVVLVTSGNLTRAALTSVEAANIQIWDAQKLAELATPELIEEYFGPNKASVRPGSDAEKAHAFSETLSQIPPGNEKWSMYQALIADILEFLFCPPLAPPRYELADGDMRNRRDVIFENPQGSGFWAQVRSDYSAHYIVVDAKNYEEEIDKGPVLDIAHYLKPYGCGMFALLVSRHGPSPAGSHATREQWIGGNKMIVHLNDTHILEMLSLRAKGGEPQEVIRQRIADFRMSL
jgi:hypothetical protein